MYIFNSFYLLYSYDPSVCVLRWSSFRGQDLGYRTLFSSLPQSLAAVFVSSRDTPSYAWWW